MAEHEKLGGSKIENLELNAHEQAEINGNALKNLTEKEKQHNSRESETSIRHDVEKSYEQKELSRNMEATPNKRANRPKTPTYTKKAPKQLKKQAYKKTLHEIQHDMNPAERTFSKVIHNPVVEKTSEVTGATVARPMALFTGALTSLIIVGLLYVITKWQGYELSGFEWIGSYIVGWVLGLIIDWIRVAILGKRAGPA
jgi:hypothetical protein